MRVSTTLLESFRRVIETEFGREDELIASIKGQPYETTWQQAVGLAWEAALATPRGMCERKKESGNYYVRESAASDEAERIRKASGDMVRHFACPECGCWHIGKPSMVRSAGYLFDDAAIAQGKALLGPGLWQVKGTRTFDVGGVPVSVVAKLDHVRGGAITDCKATFSTIDARKFEPSLQWRFYLLVHGGASVRYAVWHFGEPRNDVCHLVESQTFRMWPYPYMERECVDWLRRFVDWADSRGLLGYLEREGSSATLEAAAC